MGRFSAHSSGLTFNFTPFKGIHASQSELYILKKLCLLKNVICEVSITITVN